MTDLPEAPAALGRTLRRGAVISAVTLVVVQAVSFLQTLVVARLLSPAEIGVYAAGTVLSSFLLTFSEGGLRGALIQRQRDVAAAAVTVFWATLLGGLLMSLLTLAAAPLVAIVFDSRTAGLVAAVSSGTLLLHALTNVPDALMQRRFNFKRRLIVDPSVAVSYAVVAVLACSVGFGVWGLVIATYVSHLVWIGTTWSLAGWRPGGGRPGYRLWREMTRFALPLVVNGAADRLRTMAEMVVVGRGIDAASLGYYKYGRRISMMPGLAVVEICSYVMFPAFSRIAGDPVRLKQAFLRALGWIWFAAVPVAALLVALGQPLVVVLLGERWRGAGIALVAMAGYGLGEAMNAVSAESMKGAGRSQLLNWITLVAFVAGLGLVVALLPLGVLGVGLAISATAILVGITGLALARPVVGVSVAELLRVMLPPVAGALVALAVLTPLEHLVLRSDERGVGIGLALLAVESIAFLAIYLTALRLLAPATVAELRAGAGRLRTLARRQQSP